MKPNGPEFWSTDLLRVVRGLERPAPLTKQLEDALRIGPGYGRAWYSCQQEHWLRWLEGYPTAGPYGRKPVERTLAVRVYNRVNCPPMVFWLGEAVGAPHCALERSFIAACNAPDNQASQTAAVRTHLPWSMLKKSIG